MPTDEQVTEDHLLTPFEGIRIHSSASETYFLEHSYRLLPGNSTIPVDENGKAHTFDIVDPTPLIDDSNGATEKTPKTVKWHCNPKLCKISRQSIQGVTTLFKSISLLTTSECCSFYQHLDDCDNPCRNDRMGHALHCTPDSQCHSLLRPARIMASHFPVLRSYMRRVYEIRQLIRHTEAVKTAMSSSKFEQLKAAVDDLVDLMSKLMPGKNSEQSGEDSEGQRSPAVSYTHLTLPTILRV